MVSSQNISTPFLFTLISFRINRIMSMSKREDFPSGQITFEIPLADPTGAGQVYKARVDSKAYAVKLVRIPNDIDLLISCLWLNEIPVQAF